MRVLLEKIPFLMLALGDAALEYRCQSTGGIALYSFAVNVQTAIIGLARYVANLICPIDLNVSYFHPANFSKIPWPESLVIMSACLLLVISLIACFLWRRDKGFAVCWIMFLVSIAPVIQLIPAGHIYMADRYAYVPYIWLFIMMANGLGLLIRGTASRVTVTAAAILAVVLLTCVSTRQVATWENTVTVFSRALAIDPDNPVAHANVAVGYSLDKNHEQAIQHIEIALKLEPMSVVDHRIAAETYLRAGQPVRAAQYYQSAYDTCPSPDNMASFAWLLATNPKVRNPEKALGLARQTVAVNPSAANWDIFAAALAACGKFEEAAQIEGRTLSGRGSLPVYWQHLSLFQEHKMITVE
jgi:tetratricopeptide (TPR) repeat protein